MKKEKMCFLQLNKKSKKKYNKGMSMVEVLVGFVILVGLLGGLSGSIAFAKNMYMRSVDMHKAQQVVMENIYKKDVLSGQLPLQSKLTLRVIHPPTTINGVETSTDALLDDGNGIKLNIDYYRVTTDDLDNVDEEENDDNIAFTLFQYKKN